MSAIRLRLVTHLFLLLWMFLFTPTKTHAQVSANVFERVLNVRVNAGTKNESTATAFTVDVEGREYLVTAKHVVNGLKDADKIDVSMNDGWVPLAVRIFRCDDPVDIAIIIPPHQLTVNFDMSVGQTFFIGQDAYFLGFPYGLQSPAHGANGPYPLAIIKHGSISAIVNKDTNKKETRILLDGYNNPGFSGGPIVYRDLNQSSFVLKLAGVISGFVPDVVPVMSKHDIKSPAEASDTAKIQPWRVQQRADGTYFEYIDGKTFVALNAGIVIGFQIDPAIDLIRKHPIGPLVRDLPGNQPSN